MLAHNILTVQKDFVGVVRAVEVSLGVSHGGAFDTALLDVKTQLLPTLFDTASDNSFSKRVQEVVGEIRNHLPQITDQFASDLADPKNKGRRNQPLTTRQVGLPPGCIGHVLIPSLASWTSIGSSTIPRIPRKLLRVPKLTTTTSISRESAIHRLTNFILILSQVWCKLAFIISSSWRLDTDV